MSLHTFGAAIDLEEKAVHEEDDVYKFSGYAAVFNNVDQGNDVIMPGAFAKSLREHGLPAILFNHKMDACPVGVCTDAKEDRKGLLVKGELPKDDDFVRGQLYPQLKRRSIKGMSIGYKATETERRKGDGARMLKTIRLWEASFVTFPMNVEAGVESIKGLIPFQGLPIEPKPAPDVKVAPWDAEAALARIKARFGESDEEIKRAFLFVGDDLDTKLLIADVNDRGDLVANRVALYKAAASVQRGSRIPDDAQDAVRDSIERYYAMMDQESPFKSIGVPEWKALDCVEREARLKGLGLANDLARALASMQLGQREADRKSNEREARSSEEQALLNTAFAAFGELVSAIKSNNRAT